MQKETMDSDTEDETESYKQTVDCFKNISQPLIAKREEEHITVTLAIAQKWRSVGKDHSLSTDSEIASFLLRLYKPSRQAKIKCLSCINCKKVLSTALCPQCAVSYSTPAAQICLEDSNCKKRVTRDAKPKGSYVMVKLEKKEVGSDVEDNLIVHFEDAAIQTDQQGGSESQYLQPLVRLPVRRSGRKHKNYAPGDEDYVPPRDEWEDSGSRSPSPVPPKVINGRRGRPRKNASLTGKAAESPPAHRSQVQKTPAHPSQAENNPRPATRVANKLNLVTTENSRMTAAVAVDCEDDAGLIIDQNSDEDSDSASQNSTEALTPAAGKDRGEKVTESGEKRKQQRKIGEFPCHICGAVFKEAYMTKRHQRIHSDEHGRDWQYKCEECKRPFRQKGLYDAHMRTHTGTKLFACAVCDIDFAVSKLLKRHVQSQHSDVATMQACYKCAQCHSTFSVYKKYSNHMYRHTLDKNHICEICSKAFCEPSLLATHMRVHTDERPFTCTECGYSFRQLGSLTTHMQRHRGEKNFGCHLCPVKYYSKHQLKTHLAAHKGEKSYLCQLCGAGYTNSKSLQVHMRSHTGERPFKCDECGKDFARPSSFKQHKLIHSNIRPYTCTICATTFVDNSNFRRHYRLKHAGQDKKPRSNRPRGGFPPVPRSSEIGRNLGGRGGHNSGGSSPAEPEQLDPVNFSSNVDSFREFIKEEQILGAFCGNRGERAGAHDRDRLGFEVRQRERPGLGDSRTLGGDGRRYVDVAVSRGSMDVSAARAGRLVVDPDHLRQAELQDLLVKQPQYPVHYQF